MLKLLRVMRRNCTLTSSPWNQLCTCTSMQFSRLGILDYFTLTESHKTKSLLSEFPGGGIITGYLNHCATPHDHVSPLRNGRPQLQTKRCGTSDRFTVAITPNMSASLLFIARSCSRSGAQQTPDGRQQVLVSVPFVPLDPPRFRLIVLLRYTYPALFPTRTVFPYSRPHRKALRDDNLFHVKTADAIGFQLDR